MKLRLRCGGSFRDQLDVDDDLRLDELKERIGTRLAAHVGMNETDPPMPLRLSLNGRDELEVVGDPATATLRDAGLRQGDLVHILNEEWEARLASEKKNKTTAAISTTATTTTTTTTMTRARSPLDRPLLLSFVRSSSSSDNENDGSALVTNALYDLLLLQQQQSGSSITAASVLGMVLHALMLESGFVHQADRTDGRCYLHATIPGDRPRVFLRHLTLGNHILAFGFVESSEPTNRDMYPVHIGIDMSNFVRLDRPLSEPDHALRNLPLLSRLFKDKISHPLVLRAQRMMGISPTLGLESLSSELKLLIMSHLDVVSLCRLCQVNKELSILACDEVLWRRLVGNHDFPPGCSSSKLAYKQRCSKMEYMQHQWPRFEPEPIFPRPRRNRRSRPASVFDLPPFD